MFLRSHPYTKIIKEKFNKINALRSKATDSFLFSLFSLLSSLEKVAVENGEKREKRRVKSEEYKKKKPLTRLFLFAGAWQDVFATLHSIEEQSELALLVRGFVLVDDAAGGRLIQDLHGCLVSGLGLGLVAGFDRGVELFDDGTHTALEHLVLESLRLDHLNALFG